MRRTLLVALLACLAVWVQAQVEQLPKSDKGPGKNQAPPRTEQRDRETAESSSKDSQIDISPPPDDAKNHPYSSLIDDNDEGADVREMHPWDPHRAAKNIEVGDFYFKRKNYRAALDRYQEALEFKPNDAEANFRLGQCLEKLNNPEEAAAHYEAYLKILPQGPLSAQARAALENLKREKEKDVSTVRDQSK